MEKRVSPYNMNGWPSKYASKKIFICDVTLRDGEQTAGVAFTVDEKLEAARMLDEIGIGQIQTGIIRSPEDYEVAKKLSALNLKNAKIETMTAAFEKEWKDRVLKAIDAGSDVVHTLIPLSPYIRGMYASKPDDAMLLERLAEVIEFMHEHGAPCINVSLLDATRTSEELLKKAAKVICDHKAERMRFADTVGTATPLSVFYVTRLFLDMFKEKGTHRPQLGVHLHDDFGLATANALAAVAAGADYIDLSVNGLGERSGNPDLTQVVMALEALCDIRTGIKLEKLMKVAKYIEKISGIPIPSNKPLIGSLTFADESDAHVLASFNDPFAYQGILASSIGNERKLVLGKKNGLDAMAIKMKQLGLGEGSEELRKAVLAVVKKESAKYRGEIMSDERFAEIVTSLKTSGIS